VATRSVRQLAYVDINAAQEPFTNRDTQPLAQKFGRTAGTTFLQPVGTGHYDSLQASLQRRFSKGLLLNINYTWGKAINLVDNSSYTPAIQSLSHIKMNRAETGFDRPHNVQITNIWDLPFGRGQRWLAAKPVLSQIVSGWQINNLVSIMSGRPFNVFGDCGAAWPGNSPTMIDTIGKPKKIGSASTFWYDPFAFAEVFDPSNPGVCEPRLGTSGFNNLRSPGVFNWDFGLFRDFTITERVHVQFRAEAFNLTNRPHYDYPDQYIGDANSIDQTTGRVTDPGTFMTIQGVQDLAREGIDERQFRFGLRIRF
jgi:hypothetical protein